MVYVVTEREDYFKSFGWNSFASIDECIGNLSHLEYIGFDGETSGLHCKSDLHSIQMGDGNRQFVVDAHTVDIKKFKKVLESKVLVGHNLVFDLVFLYEKGIVPTRVYDTYISEICCALGVRELMHGLSHVLKRRLDIDWENKKELQLRIADEGLSSVEMIEYAAKDIQYMIPLMKECWKVAKKRGVHVFVKEECEFTPALAYVEYCGLYLDQKKWLYHCRYVEYEEFKALLELNEYMEENHPEFWFDGFEYDFVWGSPKQVTELFKSIGIDVWDAKNKKESINEDIITSQQEEYPIIKYYLQWRGAYKNTTTYGRNWLDYILEDGRIHTKFKQLVSTGRMSSGGVKKSDPKNYPFPSVQVIPQDQRMRRCFTGQRNYDIITCDYSAQEGVILADKSQEPGLIDFYENGGGDVHSYVAKLVWKDKLGDLSLEEIKEKHPDLRQMAKAAGFALAYGGNGTTIARNIGVSEEVGKRVEEAYFKAFPRLKEYFDNMYNATMENGYVLIEERSGAKRFIGRFRELKAIWDNDFWNNRRRAIQSGNQEEIEKYANALSMKSMLYRLSLNSPIQALGAMMTKRATKYVFQWIVENKRFGKDRIVNLIHDEIVGEAHPRSSERFAEVIQECMERAGKELLQTLTIKAEPKVSKTWTK